MKTLSIVLVTALASALSPASQAATSQETRQQEVNYSDLNLNHEAGAERLYLRIRAAAREVCSTPGLLQLVTASQARRCAEDATARAIAEVNAPALTRYYEQKGGSAYRDMAAVAAAESDRGSKAL